MLVPRSRVTRFVILFPGRVGSTYLVSALDAHPDVVAEGEVLDRMRDRGGSRQLEWTRRFYRPPLVGTNLAIGFKTKLRDVLEPDGFADILRGVGARVVFLDRRNDVKHAISRITARHLKDRTGRWNRYSPDQRVDPVVVDPDDLDARLRAVEAEKASIAAYVAALGQPLLHLEYEELLADPAGVFARVLAFVGVRAAAVEGTTLKNTSDDLRDVIVNFDELRVRYTGTRYAAMFDEVLVP